MANLIDDSYVFKGGVNLQAQWQNAEPVPVKSFRLQIDSDFAYEILTGTYPLKVFASGGPGVATYTIPFDALNVKLPNNRNCYMRITDTNIEDCKFVGYRFDYDYDLPGVYVGSDQMGQFREIKAFEGADAYMNVLIYA